MSQFLTPIGRLVQGDAMTPQTKDQQGAPLTIKTGPNAGQPTQRYFIAVAFRKGDPAAEAFIATLRNDARAAWPQWHDATGKCTHPKFSNKITDGDGVDDNGKPNATKEGFAGHWVVKFSSSYPPKCFHAGRYQPHEQIQSPLEIRRGYFVRVAGGAETNGNAQKPGIYVNLNMIELAAQGPEIVSGPNASAVFGGTPAGAMPAGATPLPPTGAPAAPAARVMLPKAGAYTYEQLVASGWTDATLIAQGMMAPAPASIAPPAINPVAPPVPPAVTYVAPNTGFAATPPAAPAPPAPPPARQMLPKAGAYSYEMLIAAGWTDAGLREQGMMA